MAENIAKQAFLTRRDLLKAIVVGTTASIVSTPQALEAEDCSLGISSQEVVAWRRYTFTMSVNYSHPKGCDLRGSTFLIAL